MAGRPYLPPLLLPFLLSPSSVHRTEFKTHILPTTRFSQLTLFSLSVFYALSHPLPILLQMSSSHNLPAARYLGEAGEISSDIPLISPSALPDRNKSLEVTMVPSISKLLLAEGSSNPPPPSPVASTDKHNPSGGQLPPPKISVVFENINGKSVHVRCRRKVELYIAIIVAEIGIEGLARVVADHRVNFRKLVSSFHPLQKIIKLIVHH